MEFKGDTFIFGIMNPYRKYEKPQIEQDVDILEGVLHPCRLIVHNDDVNTFDWVIESLIEVCNHTFEQAEQCSLIIHYKGKASVREGERDKIQPMKEALLERGISASIEEEYD